MEFKERMKKICRVKYLIIFCLILLFLWWGSNAALKYWSQPLSTDISYKYGETEQGIQFPLISLCNLNSVVNDPMIKECHDGSWNWIRTLVSCMKINKTLKIADHMHPKLKNIVEMVQLWTGTEYINLHLFGTVWAKVFHEKGPCYTFDISKVFKFKYVSLKPGQKPAIEFIMAENNLWRDAAVILHTRFDLPDAYELNGYFMDMFDKFHKAHKVDFRKKISMRTSTRKESCVKHEYSTCQSIEDNRLIFERFHCSVQILYSGPHLDELTPKEATNCNYNVTLEALDFISRKESNCSTSQTCDNVRFTTKYKVQKTWLKNKNLVYVVLENPEVEYHHSYISYNLESFVGEIGGILGITLGASALTLFESLFMRFSYY